MIGPPGTGKSMLAKRLPSILPEMSFEEQLETTKLLFDSGRASEQCSANNKASVEALIIQYRLRGLRAAGIACVREKSVLLITE